MTDGLEKFQNFPYDVRQNIAQFYEHNERAALAQTSKAMNQEVGARSIAGIRDAVQHGHDIIRYYKQEPSTTNFQRIIPYHNIIQNHLPDSIKEQSPLIVDYRSAIREILLLAYTNMNRLTANKWTWPVFPEAGPSTQRTPLESSLLHHFSNAAVEKAQLKDGLAQLTIAQEAHPDVKALSYHILAQECPTEYLTKLYERAKALPHGAGAPAMHALLDHIQDPMQLKEWRNETAAAAMQMNNIPGADIIIKVWNKAPTFVEKSSFARMIRTLAKNATDGAMTPHLFSLWEQDINDHVLRDEVRDSALKMPDGKGVKFLEVILSKNETILDEHPIHADLLKAISQVPEGKGAPSLEKLAASAYNQLKRNAIRETACLLPDYQGLHALECLATDAFSSGECLALTDIAKRLPDGKGTKIAFNLAISLVTPRAERAEMRHLAHTLALKLPDGAGASFLFTMSSLFQKTISPKVLRYDASKAAAKMPNGSGTDILRRLFSSATSDVEKNRLFKTMHQTACAMPNGEGAEPLLYLLRCVHKGKVTNVDTQSLRADIHEAALKKVAGKSATLHSLAAITKDADEAQRYRADAEKAERNKQPIVRVHTPERRVHF